MTIKLKKIALFCAFFVKLTKLSQILLHIGLMH